jgi:membrane protease YdiL (CAAX protease family)
MSEIPYQPPGSTPPEQAVDAEVVEPSPRPWGFWATMGWSLLVAVAFVAAQTAIMLGAVVLLMTLNAAGRSVETVVQQLETNGLMLAVSYWASTVVCLPLIALIVRLRRPWSFGDYVGLKPVAPATVARWLVAAGLFVALSDAITWLLGREVVPDYMVDVYRSSLFPPLLWSALIVAAPLFEEIAFRGFLFRGIQASRLGSIGAVLITALLWAVIHVQYDAFYIVHIFVGGILIGVVRLRTGSTWTTIAMHGLWNTIATVETWWVVAMR